MEASASTHEHARPGVSAPARTTVQAGQGDRRLALLFLGSVLTMYVAVGVGVYYLVAALF